MRSSVSLFDLIAGSHGALFGVVFFPGLLHPLALAFDHFGGAPDLLLGYRRTRIDRVSLLKFNQGLAQLSLRSDLSPLSMWDCAVWKRAFSLAI